MLVSARKRQYNSSKFKTSLTEYDILEKVISRIKNKYIYRSRITGAKFRQVAMLFAMDIAAVQTAGLTCSRNTINSLYAAMRHRIAAYSEAHSPVEGEIEVDESDFGPRRIKGKRGRGAGSKAIVFGLFKRNGKVYTEIIPDCKNHTLSRIIRDHAEIESVIYSDGRRGYDGLVDLGYEKHFRVNHGDNEFSKGDGNHINGIEPFGVMPSTASIKLKGIKKDKFYFHLKETEFRFNARGQNLYLILLKLFRDFPLNLS